MILSRLLLNRKSMTLETFNNLFNSYGFIFITKGPGGGNCPWNQRKYTKDFVMTIDIGIGPTKYESIMHDKFKFTNVECWGFFKY